MQESKWCDECGRRYRGARCQGCEADYQAGKADVDAYHDALAIGGEDLAAQMELEAEYGWMGR
jgi:hypothetical protein